MITLAELGTRFLKNPQKGIHHERVKLLVGKTLQFRHGPLNREGLPIRPIRGHGIESIQNRHDPGAQRNFLSRQAVWVTQTVIPLLMVVN